MIDVTFLLIVFFVVVSQIVDRDSVAMDLPAPENAASGIPEEATKVVVQVVPGENGSVSGFVVAGHSVGSTEFDALTSIVNTHLQGGASDVHIRADKATKYMYVHETIESIRSTGATPRLQLIVHGEER